MWETLPTKCEHLCAPSLTNKYPTASRLLAARQHAILGFTRQTENRKAARLYRLAVVGRKTVQPHCAVRGCYLRQLDTWPRERPEASSGKGCYTKSGSGYRCSQAPGIRTASSRTSALLQTGLPSIWEPDVRAPRPSSPGPGLPGTGLRTPRAWTRGAELSCCRDPNFRHLHALGNHLPTWNQIETGNTMSAKMISTPATMGSSSSYLNKILWGYRIWLISCPFPVCMPVATTTASTSLNRPRSHCSSVVPANKV